MKKSILVIDDAQEMLNIIKIIFELENYTMFTAQSGSEALEILTKISQPDLILLDMCLTDMDGIEFLAKLEIQIPKIIENVPIVFLTAMDKIPESKAVGYIRKPFEINPFLVAVRGYINAGKRILD